VIQLGPAQTFQIYPNFSRAVIAHSAVPVLTL